MNNLTEMQGLISPDEAEALAEIARSQLPSGPQVIVEIGSYTGKSACNLAAAKPDAQVYCVDLWDMRLAGETDKKRLRKKYKFDFNSTKAFEEFKRRAASYPNVTWIKGDSAEIAKAWSRGIGLLFIDGAHDLKSVTNDYRGWSPHVLAGGWIAFHDSEGKGVRAVIEEAKNSGQWTGWRVVQRLTIARKVGAMVFPLE